MTEKGTNFYTILVNKDNLYNEDDFKDRVLIKTKDINNDDILVEKETYLHYLKFKEELAKYDIFISITSSYRSISEQKQAIDELKEVYSTSIELYKHVARIGTSEHHTGLALDITFSTKEEFNNRFNIKYTEKEIAIRDKKYDIMASICSKYGFILRYPKGKENVTGYMYEPWHFRYVGSVAKEIMDNNLTLDEYLKK